MHWRRFRPVCRQGSEAVLVVSQKAGDRILIGGEIMVSVLSVRGGKVRLGIEAPAAQFIERLPPADKEKPKKS